MSQTHNLRHALMRMKLREEGQRTEIGLPRGTSLIWDTVGGVESGSVTRDRPQAALVNVRRHDGAYVTIDRTSVVGYD